MTTLRLALFYILGVLLTVLMLPVVAQIAPLPQVLAPANLDELCDVYAPLEELTGPECLNPVFWDMEGFIHINATVQYIDEVNQVRVGRVAGYAWQHDEGRYYYLLEMMDDVGDYMSIPPERVLGD